MLCQGLKTAAKKNGTKASKGFTLVELLVVIGIIAVLISVLLPTLGRARKQAQTVACSSNLRQVGLAIRMYAESNGGYLPYAQDFGATYKGKFYPDLPLQRSVAIGMGLKPNASGSYPNPAALVCGAGEPRGTRHYSTHPRLMPDFNFLKDGWVNMNKTLDGGYKLARVKRSTEIVMLFEGTQNVFQASWNTFGNTDSTAYNLDSSRIFWDANAFLVQDGMNLNTRVVTNSVNRDSVSDSDGARGNIRWRHGNNDTANFLFVDGHVESFRGTRRSGTNVSNGGELKMRNLYLDAREK